MTEIRDMPRPLGQGISRKPLSGLMGSSLLLDVLLNHINRSSTDTASKVAWTTKSIFHVGLALLVRGGAISISD